MKYGLVFLGFMCGIFAAATVAAAYHHNAFAYLAGMLAVAFGGGILAHLNEMK